MSPTAEILAELADAAFSVGQASLAQRLLNAAYDVANGIPIEAVDDLIAQLRQAVVAVDGCDRLTPRQREWLAAY